MRNKIVKNNSTLLSFYWVNLYGLKQNQQITTGVKYSVELFLNQCRCLKLNKHKKPKVLLNFIILVSIKDSENYKILLT